MLTASEIYIQLKNSLGISIASEEDITKPKADMIKEIYVGLLSISLHKPRVQILSFTPQELSTLKYPDTGELIQANMKIFKHLKNIFSRIGCLDDEFRLMDILNPDFKRTRKFLSAFINYLRFVTEEQDLLMDKNSDYVKGRLSTEELVKLKDEKNSLLQEIQGLQRSKAEIKPVVDQKLQELKEIEAEKEKITTERRVLEDKVTTLKKEIENIENKTKDLELWTQELALQKSALEENIVNDPEQYLIDLDERKRRIEEQSQILLSEHKKSNESKQQVEKLESVANQCREITILLDTIELSKAKHNELVCSVELHKQELLKLDKDLQNLKLQEGTLDSKIRASQAKQENNKNAYETKIFTAESSLKTKKNEREHEEKTNENLTHELNLKRKELEDLQEKFKLMEEKHQRVMKQLKEEHEKTIEKTQVYVKKVLQTIENHDFSRSLTDPSQYKLQ